MKAAIEITGLKKSFGPRLIIDGLDLRIPQGSIFGFVGKNGTGKTTTMKMILGLLAADQGRIQIAGETVHFGSSKTNRQIGYLPDVPEFYGYLSNQEYLHLCGAVSGMDKSTLTTTIPPLLAKVGLQADHKKISGYSRGMKQRLGLAQALLGDPRILICDEPTSALDPIGRKEILEVLANLGEGTTVLFSTHILSDVEKICDQVAILDQGRIQLTGDLAQLKQQHHQSRYQLTFADEQQLQQISAQLPQTWQRQQLTLTIPVAHDAAETGQELLRLLSRLEIVPVRFELMEPTLEELFMKVVAS